MSNVETARSATTDGLTVSPALDMVLEAAQVPAQYAIVDHRVIAICTIALGLGVAAGFISQLLIGLINFITNFAFFGRFSIETASPAANTLGLWVIPVPVIGALFVGFMARYGSKAIRGHGIPEAMEQVLVNQSRIPARLTFLKPVSAAISIGTGGPFGAEGPIIATGGALGSLLGQLVQTTPGERKTLLSAGAAAGMAATFGSPVSAVLLAIELLLFEFRPRSIIPVALASSAAAGIRMLFEGVRPVFALANLEHPSPAALAVYILLGAVMGLAAVLVTRAVYGVEDAFERLPVHWMWWPAFGAVAVGVIGYFAPRTLGVGYENISDIISDRLPLKAVLFLCGMKFVSWAISLGSGTSGGTLAPIFTIGGGLGTALGAAAVWIVPEAGVDVRIAALVGMAALFAGASRALLASAVFAFETTLQPLGLLPLLAGCAASYLVSCLLMRNSIMTEKIARRGISSPTEYVADPLEQVMVQQVCSANVVSLNADDTLSAIRLWLASGGEGATHQGFPVIDELGVLVGVVTRRDLVKLTDPDGKRIREIIARTPKYVYDDCTVRQAADHMVNHGIGRLPVVSRAAPHKVLGMITRSDVLSVYRRRVEEARAEAPTIRLRVPSLRPRRPRTAVASVGNDEN
ncbi:MAG TPA: chloride channel protein [Pirellulales bacterium]|nr:chloride channel protein [Pirellulales bacterium]